MEEEYDSKDEGLPVVQDDNEQQYEVDREERESLETIEDEPIYSHRETGDRNEFGED